MPRQVALLRGVSPMNARMPELKRCFEQAGFTQVRTVLTSGNVVFDSDTRSEATLVRKAESAMQAGLGRAFLTHVRPVKLVRELIESDPFTPFDLPPKAKRVVTFLREPALEEPKLPIMLDGAGILALRGREVLTFYVPQPGSPAFMALLEKTFGKTITTRTWDTIRKCAAA